MENIFSQSLNTAGYTIGLYYQYRFFKGFSIQPGAHYVHSQRTDDFTVLNSNNEIIFVDHIRFTFNTIEIPLLLKYSLDLGKFTPYAGVGASFNDMFKIQTDSEHGVLVRIKSPDPFINVLANAGLGYRIFEDWIVSAQYTFRHRLSSNISIPVYSNCFGLSLMHSFGE